MPEDDLVRLGESLRQAQELVLAAIVARPASHYELHECKTLIWQALDLLDKLVSVED